MKSIDKYKLAKRISQIAGEDSDPIFAVANLFFYESSSERNRSEGFVLGTNKSKKLEVSMEIAQLIKNKQMGSLKRAVITILGPDAEGEPIILERIDIS